MILCFYWYVYITLFILFTNSAAHNILKCSTNFTNKRLQNLFTKLPNSFKGFVATLLKLCYKFCTKKKINVVQCGLDRCIDKYLFGCTLLHRDSYRRNIQSHKLHVFLQWFLTSQLVLQLSFLFRHQPKYLSVHGPHLLHAFLHNVLTPKSVSQ